MKRCSTCGNVKPPEEFHRHAGKADGLQSVCKTCKQSYNATYYVENAARHLPLRRSIAQRHRKTVSALIDAWKDRPCEDCGVRYPPKAMDFDHVRGSKLADGPGMRRLSIPAVEAEIAKCDVVCVNCHRLRTQRRRQQR
jgi:hypothetical protein